MRYLSILCIGSLVACVPMQKQVPVPLPPPLIEARDMVKDVRISDEVRNNIHFYFHAVAEKGDLETIFCIVGGLYPRVPTVIMSELRLASISAAANNGLEYDKKSCDRPGVIGTIHFHPGVGYCTLSADDVASANSTSWDVIAIVCIEKKGGPLKIVVVHRPVFARVMDKLKKGEIVSRDTGTFNPTYIYRKP